MTSNREERQRDKSIESIGEPNEGRSNSTVKSGSKSNGGKVILLIIASVNLLLIDSWDIWRAIWTPDKVRIPASERLDEYWEQRSALIDQIIDIRESITRRTIAGGSPDEVADLEKKAAQLEAKEMAVAAAHDAERSRLQSQARARSIRSLIIWGGLFLFCSASLIVDRYRQSKEQKRR